MGKGIARIDGPGKSIEFCECKVYIRHVLTHSPTHPIPGCRGADVLRFLMEEHDLTQSSLQEDSAPQSKADALLEKTVRTKEESEIRNANK